MAIGPVLALQFQGAVERAQGGVGEALLDGPGLCARRRELDGARVNCASSGSGAAVFLLLRGGGWGLVSRLKNANNVR